MIGKIKYGNSVIRYSVIRSKRRKTSEIQVNENGVTIRSPLAKSSSEIKRTIEGKKQWIYKKQLEFNKRKHQKIRTTKHSTSFLLKRIAHFRNKIGVFPQRIVLKKLKSRWGSTTKDGVINLNSNLLKAPTDVIDYVIVHELCHLKIKEHSHNFWRLVAKFLPEYKKQRKWLEDNDILIF